MRREPALFRDIVAAALPDRTTRDGSETAHGLECDTLKWASLCSATSRFVRSCPELWTYICLHWPTNTIAACIAHSRRSPLYITIETKGLGKSSMLRRDQWSNFLRKNIDRIATIQGTIHDWPNTTLAAALNTPTTRLESLDLHIGNSTQIKQLFSGYAPKLKHVRLSAPISYKLEAFSSSLEHLEISIGPHNRQAKALRQMLQHMDRLKTLVLVGSPELGEMTTLPQPKNPITLRALRTLRIEGMGDSQEHYYKSLIRMKKSRRGGKKTVNAA
ncbi:hypothetical protein SISSUDRAFT_1067759 [Sistotremastrum suecicum HHB10207 ss-3]|uniref:F-box domain-containing protein n=1 Tax=Sistotremastrum suecicum HHB10207 ss-3 TaxID=1314776 RepID=A0A165WR22_9AGAM|nr:hypothetical protein SISSUDRAFT_1067759 [Sistotremastrum suecicum HHB10207 ss-3]